MICGSIRLLTFSQFGPAVLLPVNEPLFQISLALRPVISRRVDGLHLDGNKSEQLPGGIDVRQNPVNEICAYFAAGFLGTAWQPQFLAPAFSEYGDGGFAGILGAVTCHIASGDQINAAAERLHGNVFKNLIIVCVKADRAADDRPAGHRLERAHTADGAVAQSLRAGLSEKRAFQRFPGFLRLRVIDPLGCTRKAL